jgi:UPF0755 protein
MTTPDLDHRRRDELDDWNDDPWDDASGVGEVEPLRRPRRPARWVGLAVIILANALILAAGAYGWWYIRQANPPGEAAAVVQFTVSPGETLAEVSERLEAEGIVTSAGFFASYVDARGGLDTIEPGLYLLRPGDHVGNILSRLRTSPSETTSRVTFPEGFTLQQMANRLAANENLPQFAAEAFMEAANDPAIASLFRPPGVTSLEGLVFPATYEVSNADTERQVVERMVQNMEYVGAQLDIGSPDVAGFTPYQILTIASIIEKEAKTDGDRGLIARVIYNRLALGMPLQIDATAIYGAPAEMKPPAVQDMDIDAMLLLDNPWNTYRIPALPATPISSPGRASIEAALRPAVDVGQGSPLCTGLPADQCRYLYYVLADEQGNHVFAVTGDQHAENVAAAEAAGLLGD